MKIDSFTITSSNLFFTEYISDLCQFPVSFHCLVVCLISNGKDTKVLNLFFLLSANIACSVEAVVFLFLWTYASSKERLVFFSFIKKLNAVLLLSTM